MLSEFYLTIEDFEAELKTCGEDLAKWKGVDHIQRHRMADLGQDMLGTGENFVRAHINATMWLMDDATEAGRYTALTPEFEHLWAYLSGESIPQTAKNSVEAYIEAGRQHIERMARRHKSAAHLRSQQSAHELKTAYKAYFFFIRAFQDACYGVILNISGGRAGAYSSMRNALKKKENPVHEKIVAIPGYAEWFEAFKAKRDQIKTGVNFSLCGPQWDVGVGFNRITPEGGVVIDASPNGNKFRVGDLISSLQYSTALLRTIRRFIPDNGDRPAT